MADIAVVYQDEDILVLNKPPGLVVDPADTVTDETLADYATKEFGITLIRGGIVHRLDKDTSGVILLAKTQQALENLQAQFKERKTKKEYLALVHGEVSEPGRVEGDIGRNPGNREKFIVFEDGLPDGRPRKEAVTEYEPIQKFKVENEKLKVWFPDFNNIQMRKLERQNYGNFSLVLCKPLTGRTHQIRVHLKHINFPIVSDEKYVGRKIFRLDKRWCPRLFLHARKLGFFHPKNGEWTEVESELPADLKEALSKLNG